ncbi:hypothetical protein Micbo1qcDRAFT_209106 [Microdochium bolleyi]|uniref:Major facilitator superfamily (MFS) profile domain-containing protein n=1 Tax=Microdochium bolleyi TaxID=196109 RepID=A0A136INA0_9PEZI|nr:hypothetical protein Micbo1qcDRAFT_209106 [Microdochium bolleyi]
MYNNLHANSISSAGSGDGGAAFTWGTTAAIERLGNNWTLRITGLVGLVALAVGLSRQRATDVVGLLNVGTALGRPPIGVASDRYSRTGTAGLLTLVYGMLCFAMWAASNFVSARPRVYNPLRYYSGRFPIRK